jgi:hypothetical protein
MRALVPILPRPVEQQYEDLDATVPDIAPPPAFVHEQDKDVNYYALRDKQREQKRIYAKRSHILKRQRFDYLLGLTLYFILSGIRMHAH